MFVSLRAIVSAMAQAGLIGYMSDLTIEVRVLCAPVGAVGRWEFEVVGEKFECF